MRQSIWQQLGAGTFFGLLAGAIQWWKDPAVAPLFSIYGLAFFVGSAFGGIALYVLIYRYWPRKTP